MSTPFDQVVTISALRWFRYALEGHLMPKKKTRTNEAFGTRLARIRKLRGLSQRALAKRAGISQRMVAYYEGETEKAPAQLLPKLAEILSVTTDELLGIDPAPTQPIDLDVRLVRKIQQIQRLPPATRRAVLKVIDNFLAAEGVNDDAA